MKDRCDATLEKHRYLRNFGNLVVMKECQFRQPFSQTKKYVLTITHATLLEKIHIDIYFDACRCKFEPFFVLFFIYCLGGWLRQIFMFVMFY